MPLLEASLPYLAVAGLACAVLLLAVCAVGALVLLAGRAIELRDQRRYDRHRAYFLSALHQCERWLGHEHPAVESVMTLLRADFERGVRPDIGRYREVLRRRFSGKVVEMRGKR